MEYKRPEPAQVALISVLVAGTLAWKGASLWHAAKDDSKPWFIALLLTSTAGLLDAHYIFRAKARRGGRPPRRGPSAAGPQHPALSAEPGRPVSIR